MCLWHLIYWLGNRPGKAQTGWDPESLQLGEPGAPGCSFAALALDLV